MSSTSAEKIGKFTGKKIYSIIRKTQDGDKGILANLRRGVGKSPGDIPLIWGYFLEGMEEAGISCHSRRAEPSYEEWAIFLALTLYAVHQQGKTEVMHAGWIGEVQQEDKQELSRPKQIQDLGKALAALAILNAKTNTADDILEDTNVKKIQKRLQIISSSENIKEVSHHIRCTVQLLRGENIKLDYVSLAKDLYLYQIPSCRAGVRLCWGRNFYNALYMDTKKS